jgi:hypothetical protein
MSITINGVVYGNIEGGNISIINGRVTIDGVLQDQQVQGVVKIIVEGDLASLKTDASVQCGNVHGDVTAGSSVSCDNVEGSVSAGSSVSCENVGRNVSAGSLVTCGDVGGKVSAGSKVICASHG